MIKQAPASWVSRVAPWLIWGLAAFFFFAHYVVRVTPGHITQELQDYFIDSSKIQIGYLGASFYLPYVIMQMPVGYLVDRFGSRLLLTVAVFICALSSLLFASATVLSMAYFSRILLGFCSATAFIGALKLITVWFEPRQLALLVGVTQALGMVGAATGARVVPFLNESIGWQNSFHLYAITFFILSGLIFAVVRNRPSSQSTPLAKQPSTIAVAPPSSLAQVILNKYTWINALYAGLIFAPTDAMGEFWGKEFIQHIHGYSSREASHTISFLFIGWAVGGPLAGSLADRYGRRPIMIISAILGLILLPVALYTPHLPLPFCMTVLFLYGLTNTGLIACYTVAGELHSKERGGFSIAIANMLSVLVGALMMPLLAFLLQYSVSTEYVNGMLSLTAEDYRRATYILPFCMFIAIICAFFTKETLPRNAKNSA